MRTFDAAIDLSENLLSRFQLFYFYSNKQAFLYMLISYHSGCRTFDDTEDPYQSVVCGQLLWGCLRRISSMARTNEKWSLICSLHDGSTHETSTRTVQQICTGLKNESTTCFQTSNELPEGWRSAYYVKKTDRNLDKVFGDLWCGDRIEASHGFTTRQSVGSRPALLR